MSQIDRLYEEADPDPEADEIAAAQHERARWEDRLDERARAGTEALRAVKGNADGSPINDGAARAYRIQGDLGGAADGTGIGVAMRDVPMERTDHLGAPVEQLMAGPTTAGHGGGSSSRIKKDRGRPTVAEINARRDRDIRDRPSDADRARRARDDHGASGTGRPLKGDSPRISVGRIESHQILALEEAGCGSNVEDQLAFMGDLIASGLTFEEFAARRKRIAAELAGEAAAAEQQSRDEPGRGAA